MITRPEGMSAPVWERIGKLSAEVRLRVLERSAIIQEATGCHWTEADERALAEEAGVYTQHTLKGAA